MRLLKLVVITSLLAVTMATVGCNTSGTKDGTGTISLCAKCGQIKGTVICCKADQPKCKKCSLAKGAPGCCKLPKDVSAAVALCTQCGEIKGDQKCCKPATKCGKCGLNKGAPGCCKIGDATGS